MKHRRNPRRALALLLALALSLSLPALAEPLELTDDTLELFQEEDASAGLPAEEVGDLWLPEEALSPDPVDDALPGAFEIAAPADGTDARGNTSVPEETYDPVDYAYDVGEKSKVTLRIGDSLELFYPDSNGYSWTSSVPSVLRVSSWSDEYSLLATAVSAGKSVLTLTLDTGETYRITVTVKDPYALASLGLRKSSVSLSVGRDFDIGACLKLKPAYAKASFTYRSTKSSVARVNSSGIVTGLKPGAAGIVVTSSNGLEKTLKVTVTRNTLTLRGVPSKAACAKMGKKWSLRPRIMDLLGNGSLALRLCVLNGSSGKLVALRGLDLSVSLETSNGEILIAHTAFDEVPVSCARDSYATVRLLFPAGDVYYSGVKLSGIDPSKLIFRLYEAPTARTSGKKTVAYRTGSIKVTGDPAVEDPVTCRALLVSENDFYLSSVPGYSSAWEHSTRNHNDAALMKKTLGRVRTPDGGKYSVTVQHNTSRSELNKLIRATFAGADDNDVSLFFIATHGDSADSTPDDETGALLMASQDETYPEYYYLSELRRQLLKVPGKVIVILESCGSGAAIRKNDAARSRAAEAFDAQAIALFREGDPGLAVSTGGAAANTGELRKVNKFYVLCCSGYMEESWGMENHDSTSHNFFTKWLCEGIGKSGSMPADKKYAGNRSGSVDLHELYRYVAGVGDKTPIQSGGAVYYQHVQVYPAGQRFVMFR